MTSNSGSPAKLCRYSENDKHQQKQITHTKFHCCCRFRCSYRVQTAKSTSKSQKNKSAQNIVCSSGNGGNSSSSKHRKRLIVFEILHSSILFVIAFLALQRNDTLHSNFGLNLNENSKIWLMTRCDSNLINNSKDFQFWIATERNECECILQTTNKSGQQNAK